MGIERHLLPERLRSRLNYYVRDKKLKAQLLDQQDVDSESVDYVPKPIKAGNHTFIRNLVILDTLFEDKKLVVNWLNGELIDRKCFDRFKNEWKAKKVLYQALESRVDELGVFLSGKQINWSNDEIPYPFREGNFSAVEMIADSIDFDANSSFYDLAVKAVINNQFAELGRIINDNPEAFIAPESAWLNQLYVSKKEEYDEYYQLLNKY